MSISFVTKLEFKELCTLFENIVKAKTPTKRLEELQSFTRKCRTFANNVKAKNPEMDTSLFPIYRLLLPNSDRDRGPYGLKTKHLSNLYIRVFCLGKKSADAEKLVTYKKSLTTPNKNVDFAESVFFVLQKRLRHNESILTIHQVNKFLDDVANSHDLNQSKDELFSNFFRQISPIELKWLTRILLKDVKLGLHHKQIFSVINQNAMDLFNVTSNLRKVCDTYSSLQTDESEIPIQLEVFSHIRPMLLERLKIEQIGKLFVDKQNLYVQMKFDGERSQIHMKDGTFKYFTRQGFDITSNTSYGELAESGKFLTSNIAQLLKPSCKSIILDGEMMGWHKLRKSFGTKALNYDVKKLTDKSYHQPCFVAYDILLYNDVILADKPYSERLNYLESAFTEKEGVLMMCETKTVSNVDHLMEIFNKSLDDDEEGVVVKTPDSIYRPNVREKSGCYKIKAEYSDGLVQDMDFIILGGYYGQGKLSGVVNSFLVGVADQPTNKNGMPSVFNAVSGVGSGFSHANLMMLQQKFKPHWRDKKPVGINGPSTQPPDLWIPPKHSVVVQLRATEIIRTKVFPLGYTLRFPRVLKIRDDKPWFNACTRDEFLSLVKDRGAVQKLTKRKVTSDDIERSLSDDELEEEPKIRKTRAAPAGVHDSFKPIAYGEDLIRESRLFEGKRICVINGNEELDKSEITAMLQRHMAEVVQNPGKNTFCVLVGDPETLRAKNAIQSENYDVVNLNWFKRVTSPKNIGKLQDFLPSEMFSMQESTRVRLEEIFDRYGDNYTKDVDEESLRMAMECAGETLSEDSVLPIKEMQKLDKHLFETSYSPYSLFRGLTVYFHNSQDVEKYSFTFMNGNVSDEINIGVDYIIVDDDVTSETLMQYRNEALEFKGKKLALILSNKWVRDCFRKKKLLGIKDYVL